MIRAVMILLVFTFSSNVIAKDFIAAFGLSSSGGANPSGSFLGEIGLKNSILPDYLVFQGRFDASHHDVYAQHDVSFGIGFGKVFESEDTRFGVELSYVQSLLEIARGSQMIDVSCVNDGFEAKGWFDGDLDRVGYYRLEGGLRAQTGHVQCDVFTDVFSATDIERQKNFFVRGQVVLERLSGSIDLVFYAGSQWRDQDDPEFEFYPDTDLCEVSETYNSFGTRAVFLGFLSAGVERIYGACGNEDYKFSVGINVTTETFGRMPRRLVTF
jgi:hypothetical protein